MKQHLVKVGALIGAATLVGLSMGPAAAAAPVSQATANGLTLAIAGSPISSGTVEATNDGTGEKKTGEVNPPVDVLENQDVLDIGVIAQDATALVENKNGVSRACSGVAGDGAVIGDVGESNCLTPGDPVGVNIANLDLTGSIVINPESPLGPLGVVIQPIWDEIVAPITAAIVDGLEPLETTGLTGTLGAVQSRCVADPNSASGTANIADSKLALDIAGNSIDIVNFPANPNPNTKVVTDLDEVLDAILDATRVDINTTLDGLLAPLQAVIDPVQEQLVDNLIAQIADELGPLEDNILDGTLNKQTTSEGGKKIEVTALELHAAAGCGPGAGEPRARHRHLRPEQPRRGTRRPGWP